MVDDLQWADGASAQVFQLLARAAAQRPVLVVYAYRDEALASDAGLAARIDSLRRETHARRLLLGRLAATETEAIVAALAPAVLGAAAAGAAGPVDGAPGLGAGARTLPSIAELALRLHRETDGNPFFLLSILQSLVEGETQLLAPAGADEGDGGAASLLPDTLRAAVRVRLAHVPAEHKGVLEAVAVYGRRVDFDILLGVTHTSEAALLDALDALVRRRLLREEADGGVYDYSHDKLREVVYRDIGGARRRLLHLAVAEAIERHPDAAGHDRAARLGEHYERAHAWAQALHHLVEAAQQSQALFALPDALHWFDRAVALCEAHGAVIDEARGLQIHALRGAARAQAGLTGAAADAPRLAANRHTRSPWPPGSAA
jgi:predicted ATPase